MSREVCWYNNREGDGLWFRVDSFHIRQGRERGAEYEKAEFGANAVRHPFV